MNKATRIIGMFVCTAISVTLVHFSGEQISPVGLALAVGFYVIYTEPTQGDKK